MPDVWQTIHPHDALSLPAAPQEPARLPLFRTPRDLRRYQATIGHHRRKSVVHSVEDSIVDTVDGQAVASLSHLPFLSSRARAAGPSRGISSSRDGESHRILLEDSECEIVLRHEDVDRRSQEILDRYRIPADRSPDLMAMKASPPVDLTADGAADVTTDEPPTTPTSTASE